MPKLTSFDELRAMRNMLLADRDQRRVRVTICAGTACGASGSNSTARAVRAHLLRHGLANQVALQVTGCHGFCEMGPFLCLEPQHRVGAELVDRNHHAERLAPGDTLVSLHYALDFALKQSAGAANWPDRCRGDPSPHRDKSTTTRPRRTG